MTTMVSSGTLPLSDGVSSQVKAWLRVGGLKAAAAMSLPVPALGLGTKVVTVWVTWPVPRALRRAASSGVPVAVNELVTLVPLVNVALG